jgi:hypothetical protein
MLQPIRRLIEYEESGDGKLNQEELDLLRLERDTWGLLQAVMP